MPEHSPSDEALFLRWKQGDREALDALVDRHYEGLFRFLHMKLSDRHRVEELLHDTWLKVMLNPDKFEPRATFKTWLYTVARNTRLDFFKRERFRAAASLDEPLGGNLDHPVALKDLLPGDEPSPAAAAEFADDVARLHAALDQLDPYRRELLYLRHFVGLGYQEIRAVEEKFQRPEGTLKYLVFQALKEVGAAMGAPRGAGERTSAAGEGRGRTED